jgi:hypothetical protein
VLTSHVVVLVDLRRLVEIVWVRRLMLLLVVVKAIVVGVWRLHLQTRVALKRVVKLLSINRVYMLLIHIREPLVSTGLIIILIDNCAVRVYGIGGNL